MDIITKYKYLNIARFVIETTTPIAIGTGDKDFITDSPVLKDINGLPYIPGTSLAGVVRHAIGEEDAKLFFGYNDRSNSKNSIGSEIIFTNAIMIGENGDVLDGLQEVDFKGEFYEHFKTLPIRQHNRINHKGVVENAGKFDEQIVYKGTRFCFEIEKVSDRAKDENFEKVIAKLFSKELRIGSGTRSGFGEIEVKSYKAAYLDLTNEEHLKAYLNKSSSLIDQDFWNTNIVKEETEKYNSLSVGDDWVEYKLILKADDFFLFGSGFGNDDADMTPVRESIIEWNGNIPRFKHNYILLPATSVKGTISHRVAFHYNKLSGVFADKITEEKYTEHVGSNNKAVRALFGSEGEKDNSNTKDTDNKQQRGNVLFSDLIIQSDSIKKKILNHVAIDRFTGGAIDGALFQEEVLYGGDTIFEMKMLLDKASCETTTDNDSENIIKAFENALTDISIGMLPLGGGVNRGHGSFNGELYMNGKLLNEKTQ